MIDVYLRTCLSLFSAKDFERSLRKMGIRTDVQECEFFLDTNSEVFALTNGLYITRAGIFTDKYFSIKPTKKELANEVFVAGHRCMPFVDPEELPQYLHFYYKGKELPTKIVEFDSAVAESFFFLEGEEFSPQFIMADPANKGMVIYDSDNILPPKVNLTCLDISELIKECGFENGDRLLCRVVDWDANIIELIPMVRGKQTGGMRMRQEDLIRQQWYGHVENILLEQFGRMGPCSSIEEQLALLILENSRELCVPECGSVEECIIKSEKVGLEQYGIETRLWRYGENVPAVGSWNNYIPTESEDVDIGGADFFIADFLLDAFIKNEFSQKKYDAENVAKSVVPEECDLSSKELEKLSARINERYKILKNSYNNFADFSLVDLRRQALELYTKVASVIYRIDCAKAELEEYPQQELVTMSQIYNHVMRIIERIEMNPDSALEECDELIMSVDGMVYNFDCIYEQIIDIINRSKTKEFRAGI